MNDEQRLLINAYNDGQADLAAIAAARRLIRDDAEVQAYWQSLQHTDRLLRDTFNPIAHAAVPARFDALLSRAQRRSRLRHLVPLAMAASLALVVVLLVREDRMTTQMNERLAQMQQQIAQLRNQTLENLPSGTPGSWVAPVGYARAEIVPLQTYRTEDDGFCREYRERVEDATGVEVRRGIACRVGKGDWPDIVQSPSDDAPASRAGGDIRL